VWVGFDQPRTIVRNGFAGDVAVPIWASFMKTATKGEKPQYFKAPAGVTTASVCRLSGKLANEGCEDVEVVDERGGLTHRSMVYTEYFAKDTVPVEVCDLHRRRGFFGAVASIFREGGEGGAPARVEDTGVPPASTSTSTAGQPSSVDTSTVTPPEPPKKKRGFWSKVFGIGRDDDSDNKSSRKKDKNER
jgi:membrane peptidoglycan carboxypeptidase